VEWIAGVESDVCPVSDMLDLWPAFRAYNLLERHHSWPQSGGWADQSPLLLDMVEIIDACRPAPTP